VDFITALDAFAVVLVVAVAAIAALAVRRRVLHRRGGTFDCSMRSLPRAIGKGWRLGVARYADETIEWYRVFSFSPKASFVCRRRTLMVRGRRTPTGTETLSLLSGAAVVSCSDGGRDFEWGMSPQALTGFLVWLEAAPPGQHVNVA
jgi:hypothetical protein